MKSDLSSCILSSQETAKSLKIRFKKNCGGGCSLDGLCRIRQLDIKCLTELNFKKNKMR